MKLFYIIACAMTATCTMSTAHERVVGGAATTIMAHPYQVSLRSKAAGKPHMPYNHSCGGCIYSGNVVLTAAHCVYAGVPSQFQVVAASNVREGSDGVLVPVLELIIHEDYDPRTLDHDIAIVILGAPLPINNFTIKAVALARREPKVGAVATVTGWGADVERGTWASVLQELHVPITSRAECRQEYASIREITDSMLCAGYSSGGRDTCQGDAGGPLLLNDELVGVVSFGYGCARPNYPGVYANIAQLRPWLLSKLQHYE